MIKSELIATVGSKLDQISEHDVTLSINLLLKEISDSLSHGKRIEVRGFGSFTLHYRPPRNAHNPKTGERLITAAKYSPHFKPGKEMQERINNLASEYPIINDDNE